MGQRRTVKHLLYYHNIHEYITTVQQKKLDSKQFWKNIQEIIPKNNRNTNKIELVDQTTKTEIPEENSANYINNFVSNIEPNLAKNVNQVWEYNGITSDTQLVNIVTNTVEIIKICKDIDVSKAACVDNLSSTILRDAFLALNVQLVFLINCIFRTGIFPNAWKIATVIPLYKELGANQGGLRKNHSTIKTIAKLTVDIFEGINKRIMTVACFIDMAKAFDTVNHRILCNKLERSGITGILGKLIVNYLSSKKQCTMTNGMIST